MARKGRGGSFRRVMAGGLLVAASAFACAPTASADWLDGESRLTGQDGAQRWPALSGDRLAYAAGAGEGGLDIRVQDLVTGEDRSLAPDRTATGAPAISGDRVVWPDAGGGVPGFWYADLASGKSRRLDAPAGAEVALSGTRACYTHAGRIRVHDLRSGADRVVSPPGAAAANCDISGSIVVWQDQRNGNADVFALDLSTGLRTRVTSDPADQTSPSIDGRLVVWEDRRSGDADIHALDLTTRTESRLTDAPGAQLAPDVSGGRVVWADERFGRGNTEVYLYDIATGVETRVTRGDAWSGDPAIDGARIAYADNQGARPGLYQRSVTTPVLIAGPGSDGVAALAGRLTNEDGVPVVAVDLILEASVDGRAWAGAGTTTTAGDGSFGVAAPDLADASGATWLRLRFAGTRDHAPAVSEPVRADLVR